MWLGTKSRMSPISACGEGIAQALERIFAAELGIESVVVDHVIAVGAARSRLEEGRGVEMTDAQRLEIRHERGGGVETEARGQLETVGRDRNGGRHHAAPMLQNTGPRRQLVHGSPPQIGRPGRKCGGRARGEIRQIGEQDERLAVVEPPVRGRALAASQRAGSECCCPQPRSDIPSPRGEQIAHERKPSAPAGIARASQSSTAARNVSSGERIGNFVAESGIGGLGIPAVGPGAPHPPARRENRRRTGTVASIPILLP